MCESVDGITVYIVEHDRSGVRPCFKFNKPNFVQCAEASRESCVSDLGRVRFITAEDWKDREVGNFARELGEFYISLGQLEPELIDKFNSNIVSDFVKSGN